MQVMHTYNQDQLRSAFEQVQSANWKNPINRKVPVLSPAEQDLITEAVIHFTGSVPTFTREGAGTRVRADGYYLTEAAMEAF